MISILVNVNQGTHSLSEGLNGLVDSHNPEKIIKAEKEKFPFFFKFGAITYAKDVEET